MPSQRYHSPRPRLYATWCSAAVYPYLWTGVNRKPAKLRFHLAAQLVAVISSGFICAGCVTNHSVLGKEYLITARYEASLLGGVKDGFAARNTVGNDFKVIARSGFNSVLVVGASVKDRRMILDAAKSNGLGVLLADESLSLFLRDASLPPGCRRPIDLLRRLGGSARSHPAMIGFYVECSSSDECRERFSTLRSAARRDGIRCVSCGIPGERIDGACLVMIARNQDEAEGSRSLMERWLGQLHEGLLAGRTEGVVLDWSAPGGEKTGSGLSGGGGTATSAVRSARSEVIERMGQWGKRLYRTEVQPVVCEAEKFGGFEVAVLSRGRRRYALVANLSRVHHIRGTFELPGRLGGVSHARAVEVEASANRGAGRVIDVREGGWQVELALRPGDGALFELF